MKYLFLLFISFGVSAQLAVVEGDSSSNTSPTVKKKQPGFCPSSNDNLETISLADMKAYFKGLEVNLSDAGVLTFKSKLSYFARECFNMIKLDSTYSEDLNSHLVTMRIKSPKKKEDLDKCMDEHSRNLIHSNGNYTFSQSTQLDSSKTGALAFTFDNVGAYKSASGRTVTNSCPHRVVDLETTDLETEFVSKKDRDARAHELDFKTKAKNACDSRDIESLEQMKNEFSGFKTQLDKMITAVKDVKAKELKEELSSYHKKLSDLGKAIKSAKGDREKLRDLDYSVVDDYKDNVLVKQLAELKRLMKKLESGKDDDGTKLTTSERSALRKAISKQKNVIKTNASVITDEHFKLAQLGLLPEDLNRNEDLFEGVMSIKELLTAVDYAVKSNTPKLVAESLVDASDDVEVYDTDDVIDKMYLGDEDSGELEREVNYHRNLAQRASYDAQIQSQQMGQLAYQKCVQRRTYWNPPQRCMQQFQRIQQDIMRRGQQKAQYYNDIAYDQSQYLSDVRGVQQQNQALLTQAQKGNGRRRSRHGRDAARLQPHGRGGYDTGGQKGRFSEDQYWNNHWNGRGSQMNSYSSNFNYNPRQSFSGNTQFSTTQMPGNYSSNGFNLNAQFNGGYGSSPYGQGYQQNSYSYGQGGFGNQQGQGYSFPIPQNGRAPAQNQNNQQPYNMYQNQYNPYQQYNQQNGWT